VGAFVFFGVRDCTVLLRRDTAYDDSAQSLAQKWPRGIRPGPDFHQGPAAARVGASAGGVRRRKALGWSGKTVVGRAGAGPPAVHSQVGPDTTPERTFFQVKSGGFGHAASGWATAGAQPAETRTRSNSVRSQKVRVRPGWRISGGAGGGGGPGKSVTWVRSGCR